MQKDAGLFLQQHGASRAAINSGRVLGYSTCPRDIDEQRKRLIQNYPSVLGNHIMNAIQVINSQTSVILTNHSSNFPQTECVYSNATLLLSAGPFFVWLCCDKLIFITIIISVGRALDD